MTKSTKTTLLTIGAIYLGWQLLKPKGGSINGIRDSYYKIVLHGQQKHIKNKEYNNIPGTKLLSYVDSITVKYDAPYDLEYYAQHIDKGIFDFGSSDYNMEIQTI